MDTLFFHGSQFLSFNLGLGTWSLGSDSYGFVSDQEACKILKTAYEAGIRFFDTSPTYGDGLSEKRIGKFLFKKDDMIIASKVGMLPHSDIKIPFDFSASSMIKSIDNSLKRLKVESIDLMQLHSPILGFEEAFSDVFSTIEEVVKSGKVKTFGISLKSPLNFKLQAEIYDWKSYQYNLSILDQRIKYQGFKPFDTTNYSEFYIARTPLNFGFLTDSPPVFDKLTVRNHLKTWSRSQFNEWNRKAMDVKNIIAKYDLDVLTAALRFPIDSGLANIVIPGASTVSELIQNVNAFNSLRIQNDLIQELEDFFLKNEHQSIDSPYIYEQK